jgi:Flp pilus assembly protein TadD
LKDAEATIHQAMAPGIHDAELLCRAGAIALAQGQIEQARQDFQSAYGLDPDFRSDPAFAPFAGLKA